MVPRLVAFLVLNVVAVPMYSLLRLIRVPSWRRAVEIFYCGAAITLAGLKPQVAGAAVGGEGVLYVSNHVSYLDILVLNRLIDGSFVAKAEVANWPLFGLIGRLTRTVFIARKSVKAREQSEEIGSLLSAGRNLILFPEGTTTDGYAVSSFKSSLFAFSDVPTLAENITIQPVSIAYTRYADRTPLVGDRHKLYTWYGDVEFLPHFLRVMGLKGAQVQVQFHPEMRHGTWTDRKDLTRQLEAQVRDGVADAWRTIEPPGSQIGELSTE
jgi:1-acyl-sn-glycerol-3-phosphate acyltransferase